MLPQFLDFEQAVADLYAQIEQLKQTSNITPSDRKKAMQLLDKQIFEEKKRIYTQLSDWQKVQLARHPNRPHTLFYIENICKTFTELHGDRYYGDDKAIVGGFGNLNDQTVMFIGHQKGYDTKTRQYRNFGMANPEGYRKALRLMKLAEKFQKPVVCLIDTPGAYPGIEAEQRGQAQAIANNIMQMLTLNTPILCIIIGEGASGGALGIGIGDTVLMLENTWYSVISPESCSSILWRDWEHKVIAAQQLQLTAPKMLNFKLIDAIIHEPLGGAHYDPTAMANTLKNTIITQLNLLQNTPIEQLTQKRQERYIQYGEFEIL